MLWGTCRGHAQAYTRALTLTLTQSQSHSHTHMFMHSTCTHFFSPSHHLCRKKAKENVCCRASVYIHIKEYFVMFQLFFTSYDLSTEDIFVTIIPNILDFVDMRCL